MVDPITYKRYKHIRNMYRRTSLEEILYFGWEYNNYLTMGRPLPADIPYIPGNSLPGNHLSNWRFLAPWDIDKFLQLGLRHGSRSNSFKSLKEGNRFVKIINLEKSFENQLIKIYKPEINQYLIQIAIKQFPYEERIHIDAFVRYFVLYQCISEDIEKIYGLSLEKIYRIGIVLVWNYYYKHKLSIQDYKLNMDGITRDDIDKFITIFSTSDRALQSKIEEYEEVDSTYNMRMNPLMYWPLVKLGNYLYCPSTFFLLERLTFGLKQDFNSQKGITEKLGKALENYILEYTQKVNISGKVQVYGEEEITIGKNTVKTIDVSVIDENMHLFIEVKHRDWVTRYVRENNEGYKELVSSITNVLTQAYKSLSLYRSDLYPSVSYKPDIPKILFVVGQSDIYILPPKIKTLVDESLRVQLEDNNIDIKILKEIPYALCNISIWEYISQLIAQDGLEKVMTTYINKASLPIIAPHVEEDKTLIPIEKVWDIKGGLIKALIKAKT